MGWPKKKKRAGAPKVDLRRMQSPTNTIVDKLGFREGLVTTLMANDPETSREETGPEAIQAPERETSEPVRERMGQVDNSRINECVQESRSLVDGANHKGVPKTVDVA